MASPGFWTSYEGWKHVACKDFFQRHLVFELPMRDGNSNSKAPLIISDPCFWTSYEGWKQAGVMQERERMRASFWTSYEGWKPLIGNQLLVAGVKFLNFLWGMETKETWAFQAILEAVFELPMRDGNPLLTIGRSRAKPSFWTSYEGWKQTFKNDEACSILCFWTSYEGWKHRFGPSALGCPV